MMTRSQKNEVIASIKGNIEKSRAIFLTNLIGMEANDAVAMRKSVRDANGTIMITRNTLFEKAAAGTYAESLLSGLKGTNAIAFAFEDAPGVAKVIFETSKDHDVVTLGNGFLNEQPLEAAQVIELAQLPSRDEMLGTLLATMNAPVSAFARLMNTLKDNKAEESGSPEQTETETTTEADASTETEE